MKTTSLKIVSHFETCDPSPSLFCSLDIIEENSNYSQIFNNFSILLNLLCTSFVCEVAFQVPGFYYFLSNCSDFWSKFPEEKVTSLILKEFFHNLMRIPILDPFIFRGIFFGKLFLRSRCFGIDYHFKCPVE